MELINWQIVNTTENVTITQRLFFYYSQNRVHVCKRNYNQFRTPNSKEYRLRYYIHFIDDHRKGISLVEYLFIWQ